MAKSGQPRRKPSVAAGGLPIEALLKAQNEIIDLMSAGAGLSETLSAIARMVEHLAPPALCSVLLLQPDGRHMRPGAAPSLPEAYTRATDGLEIGPAVGSCGTAAFRKTPVIVRDIATDPLWEGPRDFALSFGLRACWSQPVLDETGTVLGTIAMYYRSTRAPKRRDFGLLKPGARLVKLALARHRKEEELRAAEARNRLAAEAADLGTYDIDLVSGRIVWSDRFKQILGYPADVTPTHEALTALVHPDDRLRFDHAYGEWITGDRALPRAIEYRITRADDGAERIVSLPGRVLFNAQGTPVRAVGIGADVTDARVAETRQRDIEQRVHQLQKMEALGQLAGGIAHDLNNTLMPILGLSKLALQEISPLDPLRENLELIHRSGERARDLVNQILLFSRKEEIARAAVDLAALVRESLTLLRASVGANIAFELDIRDEPVVWANRGQIDQVLTNLVANAAHAIGAHAGTVRIELAIGSTLAGVRMVHLAVADNGPGIDPAALNRLFEPFFTTKRIGEGTGLGLAMAHGIVANHGGRIEVKSRVGEGARFDVWLPLFEPAADPASALEEV